MLEKVKTAILLSDVPDFYNPYVDMAYSMGVYMTVSDEWNDMCRLTSDVIILGSKYLDRVNVSYYSKVIIILRSDESPEEFIEKGITRFIFDYTNERELRFALYKTEAVTLHSSSKGVKESIKASGLTSFCIGKYDFKFDKNIFRYDSKALYLCDSQKAYLAEWLLNAHKDNSKRMILCNMRKKFGSEFLADIDRFGRLKEE